jgi:hypothetical protein
MQVNRTRILEVKSRLKDRILRKKRVRANIQGWVGVGVIGRWRRR